MRLWMLALILFPQILWAAPPSPRVDSEYFWMAYASETLIYPEFEYNYAVSDRSTKTFPITKESLGGTSMLGTLQIERGLFSALAAGARFGYGTGTADYTVFSPGSLSPSKPQTTYSDGFEDVEFYAKSRYDFSKGSLHGGIRFAYSADRRRVNFSGDSNRFSGGNTLVGYLGFEYPIRDFIFGIKADVDLYKSDRIAEDYTGLQTVEKKGLSRRFSAFTEFLFSSFQLGAAFVYAMRDPSDLSQFGITTGTIEGQTGMSFKGYGAIGIAPWINLLPSVTYATVLSREILGRNIDQEYNVTAAIGARFAF